MTDYSLSGLRRNRTLWLKYNGFEEDPFPDGRATICEYDPLFKVERLPAFIDPPEYKKLIRNDKTSFIFSYWGSGKTALRYHIQADWQYQWNMGNRNNIVIEYIADESLDSYVDIRSQIRGIVRKINDVCSKDVFSIDLKLTEPNNPEEILRNVANTLKRTDVRRLIILIDITIHPDDEQHIAQKKLRRIYSLAKLVTQRSISNLEGVVFKFFLPLELSEIISSKLPISDFRPIKLNWNKERLDAMLYKRLQVCSVDGRKTLSGLCDRTCASTIDDYVVEFGRRWQKPRAMWALTNTILEEHFKEPNSERFSSEKISRRTIQKATDAIEIELQHIKKLWMQMADNLDKDSFNLEQELGKAVQEIMNGQPKRLENFLNGRLNLSELKTFCFHLSIEYEDISGNTKREKIIDFIKHMQRYGRIEELPGAWKKFRG